MYILLASFFWLCFLLIFIMGFVIQKKTSKSKELKEKKTKVKHLLIFASFWVYVCKYKCFVSPLSMYYTDGLMFYHCYLFDNFFN